MLGVSEKVASALTHKESPARCQNGAFKSRSARDCGGQGRRTMCVRVSRGCVAWLLGQAQNAFCELKFLRERDLINGAISAPTILVET
jgi:hypothetical protein